ncbi:pyridoxal phosphate phosphatase PHOSPHO2 [Drosophila tropicalis]|uniref:pyridoxal phosphate phosphatase PHOSPHO2 n=1 Tax=Drosophila tropicalis TaxID=46794 RepID=UPI0035AB9877
MLKLFPESWIKFTKYTIHTNKTTKHSATGHSNCRAVRGTIRGGIRVGDILHIGSGSGRTAAATAFATMAHSRVMKLRRERRHLAAFDFDHTIVAQNTDTVVRDLLPADVIASKDLNELVENDCWTEYMAEVFRLLHKQQVSESRIRDTIRGIPEVPGFVRLIKHLNKKLHFDLIIISDSNSVFIDEWLVSHNLADCIKAVFTNPAHFDETSGQLHVSPHHRQTDCKLSASNLCKGRVLEHFVIERDLRNNIRYDHVFYVGDGNNDICPVLRQRACDFACARQGFAMEKHLLRNRNKLKLRPELLIWRNGFDLMEQILALPQLKELIESGSAAPPSGVAAKDEDAIADGGEEAAGGARRASAVTPNNPTN